MRQWHLLRLLESSRGVTLDEIADRLPADYPRHGRTIRRDLEGLATIFPILNERSEGRVRWRLMDGTRQVPALSFSPTELMALMISRSLLKPLAGTEIQNALDTAMAKASKLLPAASIDYVQQMQSVFAVGLGPHKNYRLHRETIDRLTEAIAKKRTVQMRYYSASRLRTTRREVDPYRLWYAAVMPSSSASAAFASWRSRRSGGQSFLDACGSSYVGRAPPRTHSASVAHSRSRPPARVLRLWPSPCPRRFESPSRPGA